MLRLVGRTAWKFGRWLLAAAGTGMVGLYIAYVVQGMPKGENPIDPLVETSVPLWMAIAGALILVVALAILVDAFGPIRVVARASPSTQGELDMLRGRVADARQALRAVSRSESDLNERIRRQALYLKVLLDVMDYLQRLVIKDFSGIDADRVLEKDVLEPICSAMNQHHAGAVRMAILDVGAEPFVYRITHQASWGPGADDFRWDQAQPLEELGFERGESVLSQPILRGATTSAMLVVLASTPFSPEDGGYLELVAAAISLLQATWPDRTGS